MIINAHVSYIHYSFWLFSFPRQNRYILNYLRDGGVNHNGLPRDRQVLKELRNEAIYFQLNGLVQTIEKYL